ncbi:MAG: DUF4340 domain-containing protein [Pseudomonadota bacterium]
MKRELAKIAGAFLLLIALLFVVWGHRKGQEKSEGEKKKEQSIVSLDLEKVDRIVISETDGSVTLERRRKDGKGNFTDRFARFTEEFEIVPEWRIVEPVETLPDHFAVTTLLANLKDLTASKTVSETGEHPTEYGLVPAKVKVELFGKGEKNPLLAVSIGDSNTAANGIYVQTSASPKIHLAGMSLDYLRTRKFSDWRKKEVIGIKEPTKVKKITVDVVKGKKKERVVVGRDAKGVWEILEPTRSRADGSAVDIFLNELKSLRATEIASDNAGVDAKKFSLDRPFARIALEIETNQGKETQELIAGGGDENDPGKGFSLRRLDLPQIFSIASYMREKLSKNFNSFVAKSPFTLESAKITSVEVDREGDRTELWKKGEKWTAAKPAGVEADEAGIGSFLSYLGNFKAREYLGKSGTVKSTHPVLRVSLAAGDRKESISVFAAEGGEPEVLAQPSGIWYRIPTSDLETFHNQGSKLLKVPTPVPATPTPTPSKARKP